jgi:radical SAM superfamily enzyme YgiQ (UPF0313 family)
MSPEMNAGHAAAKSASFQEWFDRAHPQLTGAGTWLRGGELNVAPPEEYDACSLRILLVRLSTYFDTRASFTHQLLYQIAAGTRGVFPDLCYLPPQKDAALFRRDGVPWLLGTQTKRGPGAFEVIGFSLSVVQELLNLPRFIWESGLPLSKRQRLGRPEIPLLLLGGASALYSSVCWGEDPWVDAVFVGEDDQAIRRILEVCREGKARGLPKQELLAELGEIPGVLEPDGPRSVRKAMSPSLNAAEALERGPVPHLPDRMGTGHLQISEGCPCFCAFCAESWDRKPYRERSTERLLDAALRMKAAMGLEEIEISSSNFNTHSGIYRLLWDLVPLFRRVNLKSQRFDLLAHDPRLVSLLRVLGKTSITCGLEGVSPRLRHYLHKNLSDEDVRRGLEAIFASRPRELKVFLVATGLEEEQDFVALEDLLRQVGRIRDGCHAATRVIFSITPLVRFPWTPLEFEDAFPMQHYDRIIARTRQSVRRAGLEFREAADTSETWVSQVLVRASSAEVGRALLRALQETDFVYYRNVPRAFVDRFRACLRTEGCAPEELLRGHSLEESRKKPWSRIETGVKREFLWEEVERARRYEEEDYCFGRNWTRAKCHQCGACSPEQMADLLRSPHAPPPALDAFRQRVRAAEQDREAVRFWVRAAQGARGLPRRALGVALARALLLTERGWTSAYRGYGGAYFDQEDEAVWLEGEDVLTLFWTRSAVGPLAEAAARTSFVAAVNRELGSWGEWLGLAPSSWAPTRILVRSPFAPSPDGYLKALGIRFTLRRSAEGGYQLELSPASLKKGVLSHWSWRPLPGGEVETTIVPGPKFRPDLFLRQGFELPEAGEWVRARATVFG